MNKICTNLSQSNKLIELGIDVNTADMHYHYDLDFDELEHIPTITEEVPKEHFVLFPKDIPAWSLTALLGLMPKKITFKHYFVCVSLVPCGRLWFCHFVCKGQEPHFGFFGDSPIDAAVEMIVWLKENGKI